MTLFSPTEKTSTSLIYEICAKMKLMILDQILWGINSVEVNIVSVACTEYYMVEMQCFKLKS